MTMIMIIRLTDSDNGNINDNDINNSKHNHLTSLTLKRAPLNTNSTNATSLDEAIIGKYKKNTGLVPGTISGRVQQDSGWCGCPVFHRVFGACKWMLSKEEHARSTVNIVDCC